MPLPRHDSSSSHTRRHSGRHRRVSSPHLLNCRCHSLRLHSLCIEYTWVAVTCGRGWWTSREPNSSKLSLAAAADTTRLAPRMASTLRLSFKMVSMDLYLCLKQTIKPEIFARIIFAFSSVTSGPLIKQRNICDFNYAISQKFSKTQKLDESKFPVLL